MAQVITEIPSEEVIQSVQEEPGLKKLMEEVKTHEIKHVNGGLGKDFSDLGSFDRDDM